MTEQESKHKGTPPAAVGSSKIIDFDAWPAGDDCGHPSISQNSAAQMKTSRLAAVVAIRPPDTRPLTRSELKELNGRRMQLDAIRLELQKQSIKLQNAWATLDRLEKAIGQDEHEIFARLANGAALNQ